MKLLGWALSFVLFAASGAFAQEVATSSGTVIRTPNGIRTLSPIEGLTTENGLRQGGRIAEIVLGELTAEVATLVRSGEALDGEIAAFNQNAKNTQAALVSKKADLDGRIAIHEAEAARQHAAAARGCPDTACVARINAWRDRVDASKSWLEARWSEFKLENDNAVAKSEAGAKALNARDVALKAKMGLAYRQLKLCYDYSLKIREMLKVKFRKEDVHSPILNTAMEQLKELSGRGFDR